MCIVAEDGGLGMLTMDENDGTGDGEWGKLIWVMGMGRDGGTGGLDTVAEGGTRCVVAGRVGKAGWVVSTSEMTGPEAGSGGIPPYPGRPSEGSGGAEPNGRLSTAATRVARSPFWRRNP